MASLSAAAPPQRERTWDVFIGHSRRNPNAVVLAEALWVELEAHGVLSLGVSFLAPLNVLSLDIYAIPRLARFLGYAVCTCPSILIDPSSGV